MSYVFLNRGGKLYVRVNLGEHNKRIVKSLSFDIGDREIQNNRMVGSDKVCQAANDLMHTVGKILDQQPDDIKDALSTMMMKDQQPDDMPFMEFMANYIESLRYGDIRPNGKRLTDSTINTYEFALERYKEYVGYKDIFIYKSDVVGIRDIRRRAQKIQELDRHWLGFMRYLQDDGMKNSSIRAYFSKIKAVGAHIKRTVGVEIPINANVTVIDTEPFVWPVDFTLKFLAHKEFRNKVYTNAMKLQLLTCLRPGDLLDLKEEEFISKEEGDQTLYVIERLNSKGQIVTKARVPERIWRECKHTFQKWGKIVPVNTIWEYRNQVKAATAELGGEDIEATVYDQEGDRVVAKRTNLAAATSPHVLRKAGINLYKHWGVDDDTIKNTLSGHKSDRAYRNHYIKRENRKLVDVALDKATKIV